MSSLANDNPLSERRVLVTRPRHQAVSLCRLIKQAGGRVVRFPVLEILPSSRLQAASSLLCDPRFFHWAIFVSANAVNHAADACHGRLHFPETVRVAAIGDATRRALQERGIAVDCVPGSGFSSEALLAAPGLQDLKGKRCVIVRGEGGRDVLGNTLRARGAQVSYAEVYRRVMPSGGASRLLRSWEIFGLDAVTVTSGEAFRNLLALIGDPGLARLKGTPLVVVSERIKEQALVSGCNRVYVAEEASDAALLRALINIFSREESKRYEAKQL